MRQLYGTGFVTMYGEVPSWLWLEAIDKLTDAEVTEGLRRLRDTGDHSYPANCTQFVEACKPKSPGRRYLGTPTTPEQVRQPQLAAPHAERAHIDSCLERMREHVAGGITQRESEILQPAEPNDAELLSGAELEAERTRQLKALAEKAGARDPGEDG